MASIYLPPVGAGCDEKTKKILPITDRPRSISGPGNDLLTDHLSDCDAIVIRFLLNDQQHLRGYHCLGGLYIVNIKLLFEFIPGGGRCVQMMVFTGVSNTSDIYLRICKEIISDGLRENNIGPVSLTRYFIGCTKFRVTTNGRVMGQKRSAFATWEFFDEKLPQLSPSR